MQYMYLYVENSIARIVTIIGKRCGNLIEGTTNVKQMYVHHRNGTTRQNVDIISNTRSHVLFIQYIALIS